MNKKEMEKKDHTLTPGNFEVYRTQRENRVVEIISCCGEGCNGYTLLEDGLVKQTEYCGANVPKGVIKFEEINKGIQKLFKQKDNYIWCDCSKFRGKECIFYERNPNQEQKRILSKIYEE